MKNFIVSDLHGNGNMYNSIINFLENYNNSCDDDVCLYINGDLIDRGDYSAEMLLDVKRRIEDNIDFKIEYLGGNHELMMYQSSLHMKDRHWPFFSDWLLYNGGRVTKDRLEELVDLEEELDVINFISNLNICHRFEEKIGNKNIVLVHARCPKDIEKGISLKIRNNNHTVYDLLWTRDDSWFKRNLGHEDYFTIVGHTQVSTKEGYKYDSDSNLLNIDGGCAGYACGVKEFDHTSLVLIDNNRLIILTFNNNNEIIYGNYFSDGESIKMSIEELEEYRKYLKNNNKVLVKKNS